MSTRTFDVAATEAVVAATCPHSFAVVSSVCVSFGVLNGLAFDASLGSPPGRLSGLADLARLPCGEISPPILSWRCQRRSVHFYTHVGSGGLDPSPPEQGGPMPRATIKIRYSVRVTRRVRVRTTFSYSARTMTTARYVVQQACGRGLGLGAATREELVTTARRMLPMGTPDHEVRDAIDAICDEVDEE